MPQRRKERFETQTPAPASTLVFSHSLPRSRPLQTEGRFSKVLHQFGTKDSTPASTGSRLCFHEFSASAPAGCRAAMPRWVCRCDTMSVEVPAAGLVRSLLLPVALTAFFPSASSAQTPADEDYHVYTDSPRFCSPSSGCACSSASGERQSMRWQQFDTLISGGAAMPEPGSPGALLSGRGRRGGRAKGGRMGAVRCADAPRDLRQLALVFDWCGPVMTKAQADRLRAKIEHGLIASRTGLDDVRRTQRPSAGGHRHRRPAAGPRRSDLAPKSSRMVARRRRETDRMASRRFLASRSTLFTKCCTPSATT